MLTNKEDTLKRWKEHYTDVVSSSNEVLECKNIQEIKDKWEEVDTNIIFSPACSTSLKQ